MLERPGFTITTVAEGENYGRYRVEPLEPGYGTTLGNALRRILLRFHSENRLVDCPEVEDLIRRFAPELRSPPSFWQRLRSRFG